LDDEHVFGPNVVFHLDAHLAIIEATNLDVSERHFQCLCNLLSQSFVGVPTENHHAFSDLIGQLEGDVFPVVIFFVEFLFEFLVDTLVLLTSGEEGG